MTRRLARDAAAFLARIADMPGFPVAGDEAARRAFLDSERSRLGAAPGVSILTQGERAVLTSDETTSSGVSYRVYEARRGVVDAQRTIVFVHGGGWVSGGVDQHDRTCRILAVAADARVVSVGYRLAPEHPFPAPLDDCWDVLVTAAERTAQGGALAVMGFSSGGNLAAALALRARARASPTIRLQVLVYPALDSGMSSAAYAADQNGDGYFVTSPQMAWYWEKYRGESAVDEEPEFSPSRADDLAGLAPAILVTAEFDPLRDDGLRYADRLAAVGVPVVRQHFPGMLHGFLGLLDDLRDAAPALRALGAGVGSALNDSPDVWWDSEENTSKAREGSIQ